MKTKVVHYKKEKYDVKIMRPSKWGNPFIIGKDGNRAECIRKYKVWIMSQPSLLEDLRELEGKVLGCCCKPKSCHGDVLVELLEKRTDNEIFEIFEISSETQILRND
jgi:hypothetical protein